jgi:hypothetical protein
MLAHFPNSVTVIGVGVFFFALAACSSKEQKPDLKKNESADKYPYKLFGSAAEALEEILAKTNPRAIGFGEFHQQENTKNTLSSLERFGNSLLPVLAGKTSDLVVETWLSEGRCGEQEQAVVKDVDKVTKRPKTTEDETVRLLKRALALGIQPHILTVECEDYKKVIDADGGVDYFEMLKLVGRRLGEKGGQALAMPASDASRPSAEKTNAKPEISGGGDKDKIVAIYGGAIHNDVSPADEWEDFSFAPAIEEAARGRYVEVDLYVPEFMENAKALKEEDWFPMFKRLASADKALLIELSPRSYIIVFRKGVANMEKTSGEENHGD